jgi:hypothetical protein
LPLAKQGAKGVHKKKNVAFIFLPEKKVIGKRYRKFWNHSFHIGQNKNNCLLIESTHNK